MSKGGQVGNVTSLSLKTVVSDSTNQPDYAASPTWTLVQPLINLESFQVDSFVGVNSINTIDSRNDMLYWTEYPNSTTANNFTAIIPTNYYDSNTILPALQTAFNSSNTGSNYQVSIVSTAASFIQVTNTQTSFMVTGYEEYHNINYEIGFMGNETAGNVQVAYQSMDLSGVKEINIVSSSLGTNHSNLAGSGYKIISNIPVSAPFGGTIIYAGDYQYTSCPIPFMSQFTCILLDERLRQLNQNILDWSLTLLVKSQ